eukprot:jgi/Chlat1/1102/Chrsp110S01589
MSAMTAGRQQELRAQIFSIQLDASLTPQEKARKIQDLMVAGYRLAHGLEAAASCQHQQGAAGHSTHSHAGSCDHSHRHSQGEPAQLCSTAQQQPSMLVPSREECSATYHTSGAMGCVHYRRECKLRASCCGKFYTCRFCHDEAENHHMDRYATQEMLCMHCGEVQAAGAECKNRDCSAGRLAKYYCDTCKFWDDDPTKDIYHCPHCRLCRIGKGLDIDYFHCHKCNACMSVQKRNHKCVERSLESNCPICHEYMFTSTSPVMFLNCGHCMHGRCLDEYLKTNYICPVCSKSLADMSQLFKQIDKLVAKDKLPKEFRNKYSKVLCSDCEVKSITKFHFMYHKCQGCGSYNTKVLERLDADQANAAAMQIGQPLHRLSSTVVATTATPLTSTDGPVAMEVDQTRAQQQQQQATSTAPANLPPLRTRRMEELSGGAHPPTPSTPGPSTPSSSGEGSSSRDGSPHAHDQYCTHEHVPVVPGDEMRRNALNAATAAACER